MSRPHTAVISIVALVTCCAIAMFSMSLDSGGPDRANTGDYKHEKTLEATGHTPPTRQELASANEGSPEGDVVAKSHQISVRSEHGIPISHLQFSDANGRTAALGLNDGIMEIPTNTNWPAQVLAAGYQSQRLDGPTKEILLKARSAILVHYPNLRDGVSRVDIMPWTPSRTQTIQTFCSSGFIDSATWGMSIDGDEYGRHWSTPLIVRLRTVSGIEIYLQIAVLDDGNATTIQLPPQTTSLTAPPTPISIQITGPDTAATSFVAQMWMANSGTLDIFRHEHTWGLCWASNPEDNSVTFNARRNIPVVIGEMPSGFDVGLSIIDPATGDNSIMSFRHDGTTHVVDLRRGTVVRGSIHQPGMKLIPQLFQFRWILGKGSDADDWTSTVDVDIDSSGIFQTTIPSALPSYVGFSYPPPTSLSIELRLPGYESIAMSELTALPGETVDCGAINLHERQPDLVIGQGCNIDIAGLTSQLVWTNKPSSGVVAYRISHARKNTHGYTNVFLQGNGPGDQSQVRESYTLDKPGRQWRDWDGNHQFVVFSSDRKYCAAAYDGLGAYNPVETTSYEVAFVGTAPGRVSFGWSWNGIPLKIGELLPGKKRDAVSFNAPSTSTRFWYGSGDGSDHREVLVTSGSVTTIDPR